MADIGSALSRLTPNISGGTLGMTILLVIVFLVFLAVMGGIAWWLYLRKSYKYKIIIAEKVGGMTTIVGKDTAREKKLNNQGDTVFYLRKLKKTIPKGTIQISPRQYLYRVREDGEWINTDLGDLDQDSKRIGVHFLDKEVRFARTQLARGLKEEFDKYDLLNKLLPGVMYTILILVTGIMIWLLFREWTQLAGIINGAVDTAAKLMEQNQQVLNSMENVCSGGSGMIRR